MPTTRSPVRLALTTILAVVLTATPAHAAVVGVTVADFSFTPATASGSQGTTVQWSFKGPSTHTTTALMGLWNSGDRKAGTTFSFVFAAAGKYPYRCNRHPDEMRGTVAVPLRAAPSSGGTASVFTVTWAASALPTGHVADIQIKRPGATSFVNWKTGQTALKASFTPDAGAGTYSFRARLRNPSTAKSSSFSSARSITVS